MRDYLPEDVPAALRESPYFQDGVQKAGNLPFLELMAILHLMCMLGRRRARLRDRFRIYLSASTQIDAYSLPLGGGGLVGIVLTRGYLSAIAMLAGRAAVVRQMSDWLAIVKCAPGFGTEETDFAGIGPFQLSPAKAAAIGHVPHGNELDEILKMSCFRQLATELACGAVEFMVLHEIGHYLCNHFGARSLRAGPRSQFDQPADAAAHPPVFVPEIRMRRLDEHEADAFALETMFADPTPRPCLVGADPLPAVMIAERTSQRYLAYLSAALNFSLVTLIRCKDPPAGGGIDLPAGIVSEHPLPHVRLKLADYFFQLDLQSDEMMRLHWSDAPADWSEILLRLRDEAMIGSLSVLDRDWRSAIAWPDPSKPHGQFIVLQDSSLEELAGPTFFADLEERQLSMESAFDGATDEVLAESEHPANRRSAFRARLERLLSRFGKTR